MKAFALLLLCFGFIFGVDSELTLEELSHIARDNISGEWTQTKKLQHFDNVIKSSGKFTILNKELFWETQSPIQNELKLNGKHLYIKQNNQWVVSNKQYDKDIFLDIINLNLENIKKNFDIELSGSKQQWHINLTPKNTILKKIFQSIQINGTDYVQSMILLEANGDITTNTFRNVGKPQ